MYSITASMLLTDLVLRMQVISTDVLLIQQKNVFEKRIAALEGGVAALAVGSGAAALAYAFQALAHAGDHIVAAKNIYGGTYNLLAHTLPDYGIEATFVDPFDYDAIEAAIKPNTKAVQIETLGNPNFRSC